MAQHATGAIPVTTTFSFTAEFVPTDVAVAFSSTTSLGFSSASINSIDSTDRGALGLAAAGSGRHSAGSGGHGTSRSSTGNASSGGGRGSVSVPAVTSLLYPDTVLLPDSVLTP